MKAFLLILCSALTVTTGLAGTICPGSISPTPFFHDPDSAATGCNTLITINPNLTVTTTVQRFIPV